MPFVRADLPMPQLHSPQGLLFDGVPAILENNFQPFFDTHPGVHEPWVAPIGHETERITRFLAINEQVAGVSQVHVTKIAESGRWDTGWTIQLDNGGVYPIGDDFGKFPNGVEWSYASERLPNKGVRVYWIARTEGENVGLMYNEYDATFPDKWLQTEEEPVEFAEGGWDRYLTNASFSELMSDRLLMYVKRLNNSSPPAYPPPTWKEGQATFCVHRQGLPVAAAEEFGIIDFTTQPSIRWKSAPVRPIPDAYAMVTATYAGTELELKWTDAAPGLASKVLHTYNDVTLVGVGARRVPYLDGVDLPGFAYVIYVLLSGHVTDEVRSPVLSSWIDSYLVYYDLGGLPLGGAFGDPLRPTATTAVTVSRACRLVAKRAALGEHRWILDEENFPSGGDLVNGAPLLAVTMGTADSDLAREPDTQVWVLSILPDPGGYSPTDDPPFQDPSVEERVTEGWGAERIDPEPLVVTDPATGTSEVWLYYHRVEPPPNAAVMQNLLADFRTFHRAKAPRA